MELLLEMNANEADKTGRLGLGNGSVAMLTPPIGKDYWLFRVKLAEDQAILGFKKFSTIGIGFALEEDWNTNLPYTVETEKIFQHIAHNKGDEAITDERVVEAIRLVQAACIEYKKEL